MTFIDQPNALNPATAKDTSPLHWLWAGWLVRLAANLNTIPEYADNAAAVAAKLPVGRFYRTGDTLKVVH